MKQVRYSVMTGAILLAATSILTGCGSNAGTAATSIQMGSFGGVVHGGPNPIVGATVTLYETQVAAGSTYGAAGKVLSTTTTNSGGSFSFPNVTSPYTCDSTQYAYVAVTGGNTGANTANNNAVLMTALGSCTNLSNIVAQTGTTAFISEATTVAAAYALGSFMNVTGTTGAQVVNIGAPPTNAAGTPGCSGTGPAQVCTSNGLGHAFANALSLVSGVSYLGNTTVPSGLFNASVPSYAGSVIPVAMLNVVANAVQSCVNSPGGATGDGSTCGTLFADTTVTQAATLTTPAPATSVPTDTLTAAINVAKNPNLVSIVGSAATSTTGIFGLVTPTSYFQPTLAAAPADYSLGVLYPSTTLNSATNAAGTLIYGYSVALDYADNVFVLAGNGPTPAGTATASNSGSGLAEITYGASGTAPGYAAVINTNYALPGALAVDSADNVYATNVGTGSPANNVRQFTGPNGALATSISPAVAGTAVNYGHFLAVDKGNNLWMGTLVQGTAKATTNSPTIYEVPTSGAITYYSTPGTFTESDIAGLAIDAAATQNVWACTFGSAAANQRTLMIPSTGGTAPVTLNTGTPILEAFPNSVTTATTIRQSSGANKGAELSGAAIDAFGNEYCALNAAVSQAQPQVASNLISNVYEQAYTSATIANAPAGAEVDGNSVFYEGGNSAIGKLTFLALSATATSQNIPFVPLPTALPGQLDPCYPETAASGGVYCSNVAAQFPSANFNLLGWSDSFQIDSAGSIWIAVGNQSTALNPSGVVQMIGFAAPTQPQLSYAHPGARP